MKDVLAEPLQLFMKNLLPLPNALQEEMIAFAAENHVSIVEPEVGNLLNLLVHLLQPQHILEIGTAIGYSTIAMASALGEGGQITTIELVSERAMLAQDNFAKAGLSHVIRSIIGDARVLVPQMTEQYDLIFLDAAKGQYGEFLSVAQRILKPGGLIIADNVLINGWVVSLDYPERRQKTMVYRMKDLLESFKTRDDYQCSLLPMGDGVALLRKKGE